MKNILVVIFIFIPNAFVFTQSFGSNWDIPAYPKIGWDSLSALIQKNYPQIARENGIEGAVSVYGEIDTTGKMSRLTVNSVYEPFKISVKQSMDSLHWIPAKKDDKNVWSVVRMAIHFYLKVDEGVKRLNVEAELPFTVRY